MRYTLEEVAHQQIAREMNLSETAFIRKLQPTDSFAQSSCFGLRWFTPVSEVPLCGHATLASAAVLFRKIKLNLQTRLASSRDLPPLSPELGLKNPNSTLTFVTMSGELKARRAEDGIVLDPLTQPAPRTPMKLKACKGRNILTGRKQPHNRTSKAEGSQPGTGASQSLEAAIGDTLVQDIRYSPDTRKLLVRLSDSYDR
ncbi:Phenazine biosynthesis-like domain-containing protein 1 [Apodemus speciosus]|uniref:Phenazine biosynthesis-like domain-containing protein 1 n=1 Tax=Apodemus speciosus TaxID=105296 RepID=A0ABQ0F7C6_APOSI